MVYSDWIFIPIGSVVAHHGAFDERCSVPVLHLHQGEDSKRYDSWLILESFRVVFCNLHLEVDEYVRK